MKRLAYALVLIFAAGAVTAQSLQPASASQPVTPDAGPASWSYGPYSYDPAGNIIAIGTQSYEYDTLGRLVKGSAALTPGQQANQVHVYSYDLYGNLTSAGLEGSPTAFSVASGTNRVNGLTYDVGGNVTSWQPAGSPYTRQYTYDELDMLTQEKVVGSNDVTFHIYTADDERYWAYRDRSGTIVSHFTLRDLGGNVLRDFQFTGSSTWSVFRDYIYRDGTLLTSIASSGTRHVSADHLGSPRLFTDDGRNIVGAHAFFPFGGEYSTGAQEGDVLKFTAHERDASFVLSEVNDLDYMHARFYSPRLGRFLSIDPVSGNEHRPQTLNRYSYAINNPLRYIDPTGRKIIVWGVKDDDEFWDDFWGVDEVGDFFSFMSGMANAFGSDMFFGGGRVYSADRSYRRGQMVGDIGAIGVAAYETYLGFQGQIGGAALDLSGVGASVGVAVQSISTGLLVHGAGVGLVSGLHLASSVNQMNREVQTGQAPSDVKRVEKAKEGGPGAQDHVHLKDGSALNRDGTWRHGFSKLSNAVKDWLVSHGWTLPGGSP